MSLIREELDTDILIQEVELRPAIYNRHMREYFDLSLKQSLWEEIAAKLFRNTWKQMTGDQKENSIREAQKRWKNLRACLTRELRLQKQVDTEIVAGYRRPYVYFDQLCFLIPSIDLYYRPNKCTDDQDEFPDDADIKEHTIDIPVHIPTVNTKKRKTYERIELVSESRSTDDGYNTNQPTEVDSETNFALSLVPMLRTLPIQKKIDAQISILKVLKKIVGDESSSENVFVKSEVDDDE